MQIEVRKADMGKEKKRLKVCAYARVSTEAFEQENSLENQVSHYTEMIQSNPAYEFAGVYADFGISGFKESQMCIRDRYNLICDGCDKKRDFYSMECDKQ